MLDKGVGVGGGGGGGGGGVRWPALGLNQYNIL